jgi:hypothetical protein
VAGSIGRRQALRAILVALPGAAWARTLNAAPTVGPLACPSPSGPGVDTDAPGAAEVAQGGSKKAGLRSSAEPGPAGSSVLPELRPGLRLGRCVVVKVEAVTAGAVPVILRAPGGEQFAVDILRHDRTTPGVSHGGRLAVYLNNNGSGRTASVEDHGLGAMALARWLALREAGGHPVPALLTLRQRLPLLAAKQG